MFSNLIPRLLLLSFVIITVSQAQIRPPAIKGPPVKGQKDTLVLELGGNSAYNHGNAGGEFHPHPDIHHPPNIMLINNRNNPDGESNIDQIGINTGELSSLNIENINQAEDDRKPQQMIWSKTPILLVAGMKNDYSNDIGQIGINNGMIQEYNYNNRYRRRHHPHRPYPYY